MGIPAFFRWLSRKYPSIIVYSNEEKGAEVDGKRQPVDSSQPNPNGIEFDNLYLDMNGIIHPCTHPEDGPPPKNEDEMMVAIFNCIDRLFNIVRPRKLLYMAIDGVAPRAKMNQQRSRRFRASKETAEKLMEMKRIRAELLLKGCVLPPEKPKEEHFDSNCITPGTPFMARLAECLNYYIHDRLNNDPGWKGIKVILSDANVPGEGEHKIMDYIRKQRAQPNHDPNTQHVLCGADADLIMLGLATHEPNFTIIREEFKPNQARPCEICGRIGHTMSDCLGIPQTELNQEPDLPLVSETTFIFIRLSILREYLQRELVMPNFVKFEFERLLDDWVFMCFFVGNDFLPHLPSLEIRENAIDRLITLYKDCLHKTGGYLTDSGEVNLERVQMILLELGKVEDEIFRTRKQKDIMFKQRDKMRRRSDGFNANRPNLAALRNTQFAPKAINEVAPVTNFREEADKIRKAAMENDKPQESSDSQINFKSMLRETDNSSSGSTGGVKRKLEDDESDDEPNDEVRLWEDGFKDRYYESKFDVDSSDLEFRYSVAYHYIRGLCWVLKYYYQGCASWKWYYPYHYAPFASDFINIANASIQFETDTKPFNPLEQLMAVFPAASGNHVPEPWSKLMSDPESSIIDFYPEDFKIDLNGKKYAWQGVALLPFVDEERLFETLKAHYSELTPAEQKRNKIGDDRLYVSNKNESYDYLKGLYQQDIEDNEAAILVEGVKGTVLLSDFRVPENQTLKSPVQALSDVYSNQVECVKFRNPTYSKGFIFRTKRLKGARDPPKVLKPTDFSSQGYWRSQIGMAPATQRASLDRSGHRALNHYTRSDRGQQQQQYGNYSNSQPPPPSIVGFRNYYDSGNQGSPNISPALQSYVPHRYNANQNRNQGSNYSSSSSPASSYGQYQRNYQQQQRNQGGPRQQFQNRNYNNNNSNSNNNAPFRHYDPRNNPRNNSNNSNRYSYRR